jgi:purine-binding chemotaxis protein CheW
MAAHGRAQSDPHGDGTWPPTGPLPERPEASSRAPPQPPAVLAHQLLVFSLDEQRFGLHLAAVEQVVRVVEITPLPDAPEIVQGVINLRGRIIPVLDVRQRFRLPARAIALRDRLIIARTARRQVALRADAVDGVVESPTRALTPAAEILPGLAYVEGVVRLEDGALLIHDLDTFLSLEEDRGLDAALLTGAEAGDAA